MTEARPSRGSAVQSSAVARGTGLRHPRVPRSRNPAGGHELMLIQQASALIEELGSTLDVQLGAQSDEAERLRLLREATNRITRAANDAIRAYGKGQRLVGSEMQRGDGHAADAAAMGRKLRGARLELLRVLETASQRYPWASTAPAAPRMGRGKHDRA